MGNRPCDSWKALRASSLRLKSSACDVENHGFAVLDLADRTEPKVIINLDSKKAILSHAAPTNPNLPNMSVTILNFSTSVRKIVRSDGSTFYRRTMGKIRERTLAPLSRRRTAQRLFTSQALPADSTYLVRGFLQGSTRLPEYPVLPEAPGGKDR